MTEVLRQDEIGPSLLKGLFSQLVELMSCSDQIFDSLVDSTAGAVLCFDQWLNHDWDLVDRRGKVTFMADADELVLQAERGDHLRCTWDE